MTSGRKLSLGDTTAVLPDLSRLSAQRRDRLELVYALVLRKGWRPRPIARLARLPKSTVESDLKLLSKLLHPERQHGPSDADSSED